jgi:hypothetical protein
LHQFIAGALPLATIDSRQARGGIRRHKRRVLSSSAEEVAGTTDFSYADALNNCRLLADSDSYAVVPRQPVNIMYILAHFLAVDITAAY